MADNWSSSTQRLTNTGDWIEWTFTIPDNTTRDQLNQIDCGGLIRGSFDGVGAQINAAVVVNNDVCWRLGAQAASYWTDAGHFQLTHFKANSVAFTAGQIDPWLEVGNWTLAADGGFVTGTNTLRVFPSGFNGLGLDIDCVVLNAGGRPLAYEWGDGETIDVKPANYDTHVPWTPITGKTTHKSLILKAPNGVLGHAVPTAMTVIQKCPYGQMGNWTIGVHVQETATGRPCNSGLVSITAPTGNRKTTRQPLNSAGDAYFVDKPTNAGFGAAGSAAWQPCAITGLSVGYGPPYVNCPPPAPVVDPFAIPQLRIPHKHSEPWKAVNLRGVVRRHAR